MSIAITKISDTPNIKYGLNFGLLLSASKNRMIPIAELGPPPGWELLFVNLTILTTILIYYESYYKLRKHKECL